MPTVLLVSNVEFDDSGGRASDFETRRRLLADLGWRVELGLVPEPYVRSFLPAIRRCYRVGRRHDVDVVNSVSNPFHLQLVGFVVSRLLGVPWLAEFRDPMVINPDRDPNSPLTRLASHVERFTVRRADHIVWGDGIQLPDDYFSATYEVPDSKVTKLPFKGYERAFFERAATEQFDQFTVTYAGSFYEGWLEPYALLEGLERYVKREGTGELSVRFFGDWKEEYDEAVATADLTDVVDVTGLIPYEEIVPVLKGSDVLVYIGGDDPKNRLNVPSKVWDYVGARRPVLAVVDPSFRVANIIEECGLGIVASPSDPAEIADALKDIRSGAFEYDPDPDVFDHFTRRTKMERLAEVLGKLAVG